MTVKAKSPAPTHVEPVLIDVKVMASLLGCSTKHVTRLEEAGQLPPAIKLGRLSRWNREVVLKWLADGCPAVAAKSV
jgi:excisionase family DNA binding protein